MNSAMTTAGRTDLRAADPPRRRLVGLFCEMRAARHGVHLRMEGDADLSTLGRTSQSKESMSSLKTSTCFRPLP